MGNWSPAQTQQVANMLSHMAVEAVRRQGQALHSRSAMPQGSNFASPAPAQWPYCCQLAARLATVDTANGSDSVLTADE